MMYLYNGILFSNEKEFHLYVESKENKQNRYRLMDTENRLMVTRGEWDWGLGEKVRGLRSTNW